MLNKISEVVLYILFFIIMTTPFFIIPIMEFIK